MAGANSQAAALVSPDTKEQLFWQLPRDVDVVEVWPRTVTRAFLDAAVFLVAVPIAEVVEYLHDIGALPAIFHLP